MISKPGTCRREPSSRVTVELCHYRLQVQKDYGLTFMTTAYVTPTTMAQNQKKALRHGEHKVIPGRLLELTAALGGEAAPPILFKLSINHPDPA